MATLSNLVDRVRLELGDLGKSFVSQFMADGTTNRFQLPYNPIDAESCRVFEGSTEVTDDVSVEQITGIIVFDYVPEDGTEFTVSGTYFRYFTTNELEAIVESAVAQHSNRRVDSIGRLITTETLPSIEEYPVALYATTLALYTLATDASFDINIFAPDGVSIPRSERYRQLMEMIESRKEQYRELCVQLGIGMYSIDVFTLRRVSKMTNRYVPVYRPMEVDDRSMPQRVQIPMPTYGDIDAPWPTDAGELIAYQRRAFSTALTFTGNWSGKSFTAKLLNQRGSLYEVQTFALTVATTGLASITAASRTEGSTNIVFTATAHGYSVDDVVVIMDVDSEIDGSYTITAVTTDSFTVVGTETTALALTELEGRADLDEERSYTFTISLTKDQTAFLAQRTYWSISTVDFFTDESIEIKGGNFFTQRASTVVI